MGLVALRHVGSSQTRDRTSVPSIGRWILNHYATREVQHYIFLIFFFIFTLFFILAGTGQHAGAYFPDQKSNPWDIQPMSPVVEAWSTNHWTAREFPYLDVIFFFFFLIASLERQ